ncbi:MAG: hypothetical protein M1151_07690 [Candidatus Thermoplasmatota archaeon]|nr:hypothetical protein [Candidatus Thermoplasmatota archaeon]
MKRIIFSYPHECCPDCHSRLRVYRTDSRPVKTVHGEFTAIHRIMTCPVDGKRFRSGGLDLIIPPGCTYANDIMIEAATKRFLSGWSSSEISSSLGVSGSHARSLCNTALDIFHKIHEESIPKLKERMKSYILQIDGTTDSEFSMIVAVRDAISGFVLRVKKCHSESQESIEKILQSAKDRFGIPSGITCDMRSGIISAAGKIFPGVPIRICLMHFLRDLGKDLMDDLHRDLGMMINGAGIKSRLKTVLRSIPDYDQLTLEEIESGYCSSRERMEIMAVRKVLENLVHVEGGSGYGFPFSLRHLNFFTACTGAGKELSDLASVAENGEPADLISEIMGHLSRITGSGMIRETSGRLGDINSMIFRRIRGAFMIPERGNLSSDGIYVPLTDDPVVHERCTIVFGELEVYLNSNVEKHLFTAAKVAVDRYRKRETMLFAQNPEGTIPRTNNGMEILFRKVRRNIRKRCGNIATGSILAQSGEKLALFQDMGNQEYTKIVFGSGYISAAFARHRKSFRKKVMTGKRIRELVGQGTRMMLEGSLGNTPYAPETMEGYYEIYTNK